ncbi:MAG: ASPIC/UnbV domain-containing protein, partial [Bacteroidota bacterium]
DLLDRHRDELDFLGTDGGGSPDYLYLNDGDGTFTKTNQVFVSAATRGVTAGDYDDDGDVDLFIAGGGAPGKGLFQNVGNQHNWISLNLKGTTVNRSAIGAKVKAKATIGGVPTWQIREVSSQNSFCGSNSLRVHFGLGDAAVIDTLIVEWSADVVETFTRVDTNQFCTIEEGVGTTCQTLSSASEPAKTLGFLEANPNPAREGEIQIHYRFPQPADVQVEIFRLDGVRVWQETFLNSVENQFKVRSEKLQAGFYTVKVQVGGAVLTKGIVFTK